VVLFLVGKEEAFGDRLSLVDDHQFQADVGFGQAIRVPTLWIREELE
jgi:hypothetical protein